MADTYRRGPGERLRNALFGRLAARALAAPYLHLITVAGRRSGRLYTTPVAVVELDGERFVVAPDGRDRAWVKNARAAGAAELRRGGRRERVGLAEIAPADAVPALQEYVRTVHMTRRYFDSSPDSPLESFAAEAARHPVFRLSSPPGPGAA